MDFKGFSLTLHVLGLALGAGGAYLADVLFLFSIRDRKITASEIKFMELGNFLVWAGLALLVISGSGLFAANMTKYLNDTKFEIKIALLIAIIINALILRFIHLPRIERHAGTHYPSSDEFVRKAPWLLLSGVVSVVSWTAVVFLGSVPTLQYSLLESLFIYFIIVLLSFVAVMGLKNRTLFQEY